MAGPFGRDAAVPGTPASGGLLPARFGEGRLLDAGTTRSGKATTRIELYETAFKYPYILVRERREPPRDGSEGERTLAVMVADHVLVRAPLEQRADFLERIGGSEHLVLRRALETNEHFLVSSRHPVGVNTVQALLRHLRGIGVRNAEPDFIQFAAAIPDDPDFSRQWALHNTGQGSGTADADIDAPEAWSVTTGGAEVIVAVVDSGIDYSHPDLAPNMWMNGAGHHGYDYVSDDNDPMDETGELNPGHGTHVAGIIGAAGSNGRGVSGVCWEVKLMALRFLDQNNRGATSDAVSALRYATDNGAQVVNMSFGSTGGFDGDSFYQELSRARSRGVIAVAAAGNGGEDKIGDDNDLSPNYPSSYTLDNIIAVAATDARDSLSSSSNFGRSSVDIAAPGVGIRSTLPSNSYGALSGTSMAAPHVAGTAALALSADPDLSVAEVRGLILDGGDATGSVNDKVATGARLNAYGAVAGLGGALLHVESPAVVFLGGNGDRYLNPGEEFALRFELKNVGSEDASGISARVTIKSGQAAVEALTSTHTIGSLASVASREIAPAFQLRARDPGVSPQPVEVEISVTWDSSDREATAELSLEVHRPGRIQGIVVRHGTGIGIEGAAVRYAGPVDGAVTTDEQGRFTIDAVAGDFELRAASIGLVPSLARSVTAPSSGDIRIALGSASLTLDPSPAAFTVAPDTKKTEGVSVVLAGDTPRSIDYNLSIEGAGGGLLGLIVNSGGRRLLTLDPDEGVTGSQQIGGEFGNMVGMASDGDGDVWILGQRFDPANRTNPFETVLVEIDPGTGDSLSSYQLDGIDNPVAFTATADRLLIVNHKFIEVTLLAVDPTSGQVTDTGKRLNRFVRAIVSAAERGSLFIAGLSGGEEVDAETFEVKNTLGTGGFSALIDMVYSPHDDSLIVLGERWDATQFTTTRSIEVWNADNGQSTGLYENAPAAVAALAGSPPSYPEWVSLRRRDGNVTAGPGVHESFELDTTGLETGDYPATLSLTSETLDSEHEIELILTVGTPPVSDDLADWLAAHQLTAVTNGRDTDGDGYTDLIEYLFGGDPRKKDLPNGMPVSKGVRDHALAIEINVRKNRPERMLVLEQSPDLSTWRRAIQGDDYTVTMLGESEDYERQMLTWPLREGVEKIFVRAAVPAGNSQE